MSTRILTLNELIITNSNIITNRKFIKAIFSSLKSVIRMLG